MPQTQIIPTTTMLSINGTDIAIYTYYDDSGTYGHLLSAFIAEAPDTLNGTPYTEGELVMTYAHSNPAAHADFFIDSNGDLTVLSYDSNFPASAYAIDSSTGQLSITV